MVGRRSSNIEDEVAVRPCTADQRTPLGACFERIAAVVDTTREDRCLTRAGATRPANRNVACLAEFEKVG
jgi:hypothetical protein